MKKRKAQLRLSMRQKQWDALSTASKGKTRRPGSNKKPQPLGRRR